MILDGSPNILAWCILLVWPIAAYMWFKKNPTHLRLNLLAWCGLMFLPEVINIDPPLIPALDKQSFTTIALGVALVTNGKHLLLGQHAWQGVERFFLLLFVANFLTTIANGDALRYGPVNLPALSHQDTLALCIRDFLTLYMPFRIGRAIGGNMGAENGGPQAWLTQCIKLGLIYSVGLWIEGRFSPQLHRWIYGYHQNDFSMTFRWGGYRPLMFMLTGLAVANFFLVFFLSTTVMWRLKLKSVWLSIYAALVLIFTRSSGSVFYGLLLFPILRFFSPKRNMQVAVLLAGIVFLYPIIRLMDWVPVDAIYELFDKLNHERALSLWFRLDQEGHLLEHAHKRFFFGWGTYARNHIFDPLTGKDWSVTDGEWIIVIGSRGMVGFIAFFGALLVPIFQAWSTLAIVKSKEAIFLVFLSLSVAISAFDLLPNGLFSFMPFLLAGQLYGYVGMQKKKASLARKLRSKSSQNIPPVQTLPHPKTV